MVNNIKKTSQESTEEVTEVKKPQAKPEAGPSFEKLKKLVEKSPYEGMLRELEKNGLNPKEALSEINDLIIADLEKNPENAADLEMFKAEIEKLGKEELDKETEPISPDIVDRAERDVGLAEEVEKMEAGQEFNRPQLAGVLERQNWGKIFAGLKEGDKVLSFLVPGADFLSIKNLNDVILGPQITNKIIEKKRRVIEEEMRKIDVEAAILQSDYKIEIVKISKESQVDSTQLEEMSAAVDAAMTGFISEIIDDLIVAEREKLLPLIVERDENKVKNPKGKDEIKNHEDKIGKWVQFKNSLQGKSEENHGKSGFRMNYGLSTVEGSDSEEKLLALTQSLQTSRMAREKNDSYGAESNEKEVVGELAKIKDLREKIIDSGNKITDKDGNEFEIFTEKKGKSVLNRDLLRDVRKGKFEILDDEEGLNKAALGAVSLYIKKLNILDVVKPFTFKELQKTADDAEDKRRLAEKIRDGKSLDDDEKIELAKDLRSEEKDNAYTSKSEFNKRAVAMTECAYVSLDVLDLGVDLLLEYEDLLQDVDKESSRKKIDKFNELALSAGDKTTEKLREFRKDVAAVCKEFGFGDGLITGEVGGDELTLAVDTSKMSEEKLDEFLFALKDKTNTRVIKTVVAKSEKNISPDSDHQKLVEAHLQALKRAEAGAVIAKDIESAERKLNRLLKRQGEDAVKEKIVALRGLFVLENGQVKSSVVITEKEGVFKVGQFKVANESKGEEGYESVGYEFDYEGIRSELESILGKKSDVK